MTNNFMIQNSISQVPGQPKKKAKAELDYSKYQVGAHTLPSKGGLVNDPLWKVPFVAVKDTFQNVKNIGKGLKGEGEDNDLGKMNDVAMKAGGLSIAGYLASKRVLPVKKGMEFVGFASFFTSMVLWPKVFIQAPIQALYGFNVNQQYVDSYGRKKSFHMDPQYTPWALYDPKKIDKIGDKMGVSANMENRRNFIEEKMTKIATQANTIWMLTAGIATPVMCALLSAGAEKGLNNLHESKSSEIAAKKFKTLDSIKEPDQKGVQSLQALLKDNRDKAVGPKFVDSLVTMMAGEKETTLAEALKKDLTAFLKASNVPDVSKSIGAIQISHKIDDQNEISIKVEEKEIADALSAQGLNQNVVLSAKDENGVTKGTRIKNILTELVTSKYPEEIEDVRPLRALTQSATTLINKKIDEPQMILSAEKIGVIEQTYKQFSVFKQKDAVIKQYKDARFAKREDSVVAREWGKATSKITNILGFTDKELAASKESPNKAREILEAKFTAIAADDAKYKETVGKIYDVVTNFNQKIEVSSTADSKKGFLGEVKEAVTSVYGGFGQQLAQHTDAQTHKPVFVNTANQVSAHFELKLHPNEEAAKILKGSEAAAIMYDTENGILGAENSLMKYVHGLDLFRRIKTGEIPTKTDKDKEVVGYMKYAVMDGDVGLHMTKFDIKDPEVYRDFATKLFFLDQTTIPKTVAETLSPEAADEYKKSLPAKIDFNKVTIEAVGGQEKAEKLKKSIAAIGNASVNREYVFKINNMLFSKKTFEKPGLDAGNVYNQMKNICFANETVPRVQSLIGEALSLTHQATSKQKHNTKTWFKMVGVAGAAVAALTVASTLFLGKIKEPQQQKEVEANG